MYHSVYIILAQHVFVHSSGEPLCILLLSNELGKKYIKPRLSDKKITFVVVLSSAKKTKLLWSKVYISWPARSRTADFFNR